MQPKSLGWAPDRSKWPAGCNPHRDGWVRWYKGRTVFVCGKKVPLDKVEDRWNEKKSAIDGAEKSGTIALSPFAKTYRQVLSEFLALRKARVGSVRNSIEERTYHNSAVELNNFGSFVHAGRKIADMDIRSIGPTEFTAYATKFSNWKASGFDSVVSRVGSLFRWAVEMDYIDRYRPGPEFRRPDKQEIRDRRIELEKSYATDEVAKLYVAAPHVIRCWIALGICAAFNNSDIANLTRSVVDLGVGVIDYRRRKTGKIRRVIPLPADVVSLLVGYVRPEPDETQWSDLFFITEYGNPYARSRSRKGNYMPSNTISRLFAKLVDVIDVSKDGRNFSGLRTTHYNAAPKDKFDFERKVVMGRAKGDIDLDHYLERIGMLDVARYVEFVWAPFRAAIQSLNNERPHVDPTSVRTQIASPDAAEPTGGHTAGQAQPVRRPTTRP